MRYSGEFKNNQRCGEGIEYSNKGGIIFKGQFYEDNYKLGEQYDSENHKLYEGEFKYSSLYEKSEFHGMGKEFYPGNILKYEGQFLNDHYEGIGTMCYFEGVNSVEKALFLIKIKRSDTKVTLIEIKSMDRVNYSKKKEF